MSDLAVSRSERGAVMVQMALALFVLVGFGTYVLDHGVFWVSRNQAQNAADAAAAAGAVARAFDEFADPPPGGGTTVTTATQVAQLNQVWQEAPAPVVTYDCPPEAPAGNRCVRVDVHRDDEFGNPLPVIFGSVLGLTSQGIRATATARVAAGNATDCLRPWAIPDRWVEHYPTGTPDGQFERYAETGPAPGTLLTPLPDQYDPPTATTTGSGYQFPTDDVDPHDLGTQLTLDFANPEAGHDPISPGSFLPLILPGPKTFEENIAGCNAQRITLGQQIATGSASMQAPSTDGFTNLIAQDPGASWNAGTRKVTGSCAPLCGAISPRVVAIVAFNVDEYQFMRANDNWSGCPGGGRCVRIANMVGFFLDHVEGPGRAVGFITSYPGLLSSGDPEVGNASSFLKAVALVR
jgi:hypothetical protein